MANLIRLPVPLDDDEEDINRHDTLPPAVLPTWIKQNGPSTEEEEEGEEIPPTVIVVVVVVVVFLDDDDSLSDEIEDNTNLSLAVAAL